MAGPTPSPDAPLIAAGSRRRGPGCVSRRPDSWCICRCNSRNGRGASPWAACRIAVRKCPAARMRRACLAGARPVWLLSTPPVDARADGHVLKCNSMMDSVRLRVHPAISSSRCHTLMIGHHWVSLLALALQVSGPGPHKEAGQAEGGTSGGIAGAWRGMTSSFSVGADDMAGGSSAGTVTGAP